MIPRTKSHLQAADWQSALSRSFTRAEELLDYLRLDPGLFPSCIPQTGFGLRVPREFASCMEKGNPDDPLLRQILPAAEELDSPVGFSRDPVGDGASEKAPGLLHKYHGRALLITSGGCAVHCRYCFRRRFPYGSSTASRKGWEAVCSALQADTAVEEIILSGGDPLMLPDEHLAELVGRLARIPHLKRLRIHTRLPVVLPQRVGKSMLRWLLGSRLQPIIVLHINHPAEISPRFAEAADGLRVSGIPLFNQSVLLKGVNDDFATLQRLSIALFDHGILPYYLHLLDRVEGAAHFEVTDADALELHSVLRSRLPGYLVPRLVRETPGAASKTPIW